MNTNRYKIATFVTFSQVQRKYSSSFCHDLQIFFFKIIFYFKLSSLLLLFTICKWQTLAENNLLPNRIRSNRMEGNGIESCSCGTVMYSYKWSPRAPSNGYQMPHANTQLRSVIVTAINTNLQHFISSFQQRNNNNTLLKKTLC